MDDLERAISNALQRGESIFPGAPLSYGNPGQTIYVRVPGLNRDIPCRCANTINSSRVVVAIPEGQKSGFVFCESSPIIQAVRTGEYLQSKPQPVDETESGKIKILFRIDNSLYVGGDRANPTLIFTLPDPYYNVIASLTNTGSGLNDWILWVSWNSEGDITSFTQPSANILLTYAPRLTSVAVVESGIEVFRGKEKEYPGLIPQGWGMATTKLMDNITAFNFAYLYKPLHRPSAFYSINPGFIGAKYDPVSITLFSQVYTNKPLTPITGTFTDATAINTISFQSQTKGFIFYKNNLNDYVLDSETGEGAAVQDLSGLTGNTTGKTFITPEVTKDFTESSSRTNPDPGIYTSLEWNTLLFNKRSGKAIACKTSKTAEVVDTNSLNNRIGLSNIQLEFEFWIVDSNTEIQIPSETIENSGIDFSFLEPGYVYAKDINALRCNMLENSIAKVDYDVRFGDAPFATANSILNVDFFTLDASFTKTTQSVNVFSLNNESAEIFSLSYHP